MDYSVGSLADLISGSNTPNKPKVIKKAFERPIKTEIVEEDNNVNKGVQKIDKRHSFTHNNKLQNKLKNGSKKIKQEVSVIEKLEPIHSAKLHIVRSVERPHKIKNKLNRPKKIKKKVSVTEETEAENHYKKNTEDFLITENKSKKKPRKIKQEANDAEEVKSDDNNKLFADTMKQKSKKRKLEPEMPDTTDTTDSPPKKKKLSMNEKNAARRIDTKIKEEKKAKDPEELARTLFVGNIPITCNKMKIKKLFKKYGQIEIVRIR